MGFSEKLYKLRKDRNLSQKALADKANVSQTAIYHWEKGVRKPKLEQVRRLALALGVTINELEPDWKEFTDEELLRDFKSARLINIGDEKETFTDAESFHDYTFKKVIDSNFHLLNSKGKIKLANYSTDLTKIPEYRKDEE